MPSKKTCGVTPGESSRTRRQSPSQRSHIFSPGWGITPSKMACHRPILVESSRNRTTVAVLYRYRNHSGGDRNLNFQLAGIWPALQCVSYNRITYWEAVFYGTLGIPADMWSCHSTAVLSAHYAEAESPSGSCWRLANAGRSCTNHRERARRTSLEPGSGRSSSRPEERGISAISGPASSPSLTHQIGRRREPSPSPPLLPDSAAAHLSQANAADESMCRPPPR